MTWYELKSLPLINIAQVENNWVLLLIFQISTLYFI